MQQQSWQLCCPLSIGAQDERISLAHGEGGRLMRKLIENHIVPRFNTGAIAATPGDAALVEGMTGRLAFTTDSFVVSPLFFPGGDIGRLAVFGTVNDLVVAGAKPLWMSLSLIIEEGLPVAVLDRIIESIASAADEADVRIVTGDTKVVPRGAADGLFINTSGVGEVIDPVPSGPEALQVGDELLVTGPIGRHGIAILAAREQLGLMPPPETDCAPLIEPVRCLREAGLFCASQTGIVAMRDATRGGVTAVLHEWAQASGHTMTITEDAISTTPVVRGAAELLGLDPLHIANEGTMLVAVRHGQSKHALAALRESEISREAAIIGTVRQRNVSPVTIIRSLGTEQPLDEPSGGMLPRIC